MKWQLSALLVLASLGAQEARAYPLDAYEETGITRLEAYWRARQILLERGSLVPGALWPEKDVRLRLVHQAGFELPEPDPAFSRTLRETLGPDSSAYAITLADFTDPGHPRVGELNGATVQNPASVGKLMVALAWFQALADLHPDDFEARNRLLRDTVVSADVFIRTDHHVVPFYLEEEGRVEKRPIREGDRANLWTYLDWMLSNSSSSAASMLQAQLMLLAHFGQRYPVSQQEADAFLAKTPPAELGRIFREAMIRPVTRNGLDPEKLRQGSFFTREGKNRVPGTSSVSTSRELARLLLRVEQGRLVDWWSSLQLKRLLYLTDGRIRYASSPALNDSAVYFKSGSLYSCRPEPGFTCNKYAGNVRNYMNSVAVVETRRPGRTLHYVAVVLSNVLRRNSVDEHRELAARIQRLLEASHPSEAARLGKR